MRRQLQLRLRPLHLTFLSAVALLAACAEEATSQGGSGGSGAGGSPNTGGSGATGGSDGGFTPDGGGGMGTGGEACVSTKAEAEPTPLDMIFVLDWSQSMQGESWAGITSAIAEFVEAPASTGINAGMVFFPTIKPFFDDTCNQDLYKQLDVPIAPLPGNAFPITNSFPADAVGAPSPLYAGLSGALLAATARQDAFPDHKVIVVLAADGGYNGCGVGITTIAGWAKDAREYNGVLTYVVAVQSADIKFENLDLIAADGGTTPVYDASDISDFADKIAEIRTAALGCDFAIPPPPNGQDINPTKVNFTYTPGGNGDPLTLPGADSLEDCGGQPGWYYDNNTNPTKIIVCPASCATIQNDSEAEVNVEFGCATIVN